MTDQGFNSLTLSLSYGYAYQTGGWGKDLYNIPDSASLSVGGLVTAFGGPSNDAVGAFYSVGTSHMNPNGVSFSNARLGIEGGLHGLFGEQQKFAGERIALLRLRPSWRSRQSQLALAETAAHRAHRST